MLQQTQVSRVIPKYSSFLKRFPTIRHLASTSTADVLRCWQGMGYNRRVINLKRAAGIIVKQYGGRIPSDTKVLETLPGIGPGTAGAIAAFAFHKHVAFIETNIRRVYIHFFFEHRQNVRDREILEKISSTLPQNRIRTWYYALMDYGAGALKSVENPNRRSKHYKRQPRFEGSRRELRGQIIRTLAAAGALAPHELTTDIREHQKKFVREVISRLMAEGLVEQRSGKISLPTH